LLQPETTPPEVIPPEVILPEIEIPDPQKRIWGFWPTIGLGAAIFAIYALAQGLVTVIFAVSYTLKEMSANPDLDPQVLIKELTTNGLMLSIATIFSAIAGLAFIVLFVKIRRGITLGQYMALLPVSKKAILIMAAVFVGLLAASTGMDQVSQSAQNSTFMVDLYRNAGWTPLLWIATVIFAPLFEEAFFRGFVFAGLSRSWLRPAGTILLTSLVFASLHALQYDAYGVATVFVLGLFLGIVRQTTGSLWSTILLHAAWNLAGMIGTAVYLR